MFECYGCGKKYDFEEDAKKCCTEAIVNEDEFILPRKCSGTPTSTTHCCPNVNHGGKDWFVWLKPEEKCPECDYVYRPR